MARREFTRKIKQAAIERAAGHCEKCRAVLKPREAEVDHILPDVLGGEPTLVNAQVLCRLCHAEKTATDVRRTRKADRQRDKASGSVKPSSALSRRGPKEPKQIIRSSLPPRRLYARGQLTTTYQTGERDAE